MKTFKVCWMTACASLSLSFTSVATTVYPTVAFTTLDSSGGYRSDAGTVISGSNYSYQGSGNQFIPSVSGTLYSIELGINYIYAPGQIDVQLASDNPFVGPNTPGFISGTLSVTSASSVNTLTTFTPSTPIQLNAGTPYWVLVAPHSSDVFMSWGDNTIGATGTITGSHDGGASWGYGPPPQGLRAFRVNVLVPEPSVTGLGGLVFITLLWKRHRSKFRA